MAVSMSAKTRAPLVLACLLAFPGVAGAQVAIVSPSPGARLPAAPDYATDVLGDPWDMSNREDYSLFEPGENAGFSTLGLDGQGRLMGTPASADAGIGLLHRGVSGAVNPGRNGRRFPIDPDIYGKLAFKVVSTVGGESPQVYWYHYPHAHPTGADSFGAQIVPGATVVGARVFVADLTGGNLGTVGEDWTAAPVLGLRIDPNGTPASVGQQMGLDWVRLVPADTSPGAPAITVRWTGPPGTYTVTVQELAANAAQPLTIASGVAGTSIAWKYALLPPGPYRLSVVHDGSAEQATADFTINAPPLVHVTDPDETGGDDFAAVVLDNPWDMSDPADVVEVSNVSSSNIAGGQLDATSLTGEAGGDSGVVLLRTDLGSSPLIDSLRYHRLTYRFTLDGPFDAGPGGSVARFFWGAIPNRFDRLSGTEDVLVWPGANSYTIDLATLQVGIDQGIEPAPAGWDTAAETWSASFKRFFRFDPHEGTAGRSFHVDDVRLTADDRPADDGTFTIRWNATDADAGDAPTVALALDTDQDPTNGTIPLAAGLPAAAGAYVWDATTVAPGVYYVLAEVSDGLDTTRRYSTGPVRTSPVPTLPEQCGDCVDNDGNGLTDYDDPACCPQPGRLRLVRGRFLARHGDLTQGRLALRAAADPPAFAGAAPASEDVTIQLRNATGDLLCATIDPAHWTAARRGVRFRDPPHRFAGGLSRGALVVRGGSAQLLATSYLIDLSRYGGDLGLTLRVGSRCAQGTAALRPRGKQGFVYP